MAVVVPRSETPAIEFELDGHASEHHESLGAPVSLSAMHEESPHSSEEKFHATSHIPLLLDQHHTGTAREICH